MLLMVLLFRSISGEVHVIFTSALIKDCFEERKEEYLKSIQRLRSYGKDPWIIEATNVNHSFFDRISSRVLYPQVHDSTYKNKGCNELLSMRAAANQLPFEEEDVVIKITGRYFLYRPDFIKTIMDQPEYDVYVKQWPKKGMTANPILQRDVRETIFTGCFAMKWRHFKDMLDSINEKNLEKEMKCIEEAVAEYIQERQLNMLAVEKIFMVAKIFGFGGELWRL